MEPRARREQIRSHAAQLFGQKGYHATSVADIIEAAGVARGTFYLYFKNKRAIFDEILDMLVVEIKGCIHTVTVGEGAPSVEAQIITNITRVLALLTSNRALLSILLKGAVGIDDGFDAKLSEFYEQIVSTMESSLRLGQEMGLIRKCDCRTAALTGVGALKEMLHDALRRDAKIEDTEKLVSGLLDIYLYGVSSE